MPDSCLYQIIIPHTLSSGRFWTGLLQAEGKLYQPRGVAMNDFVMFFFCRGCLDFCIYIYIHSYSLNRGRFRLQIWMDNSEKKQTKIWRNPKIASPLASRNVVRETISLQVSRICGKGTKGEIEPTKTVLFPFSLTVKMTSITGRLTCHCLGVL